MSLSIGIDPKVASLFTAIGLTDADGQVVMSWFDDPMSSARTVLSNPVQRAALLRVLDEVLPADADLPGWHPLLNHELGDVYVTVEGETIGVAAALHATLDSGPTIRGSVRLPLVNVSGELRPIAGSAEGPVRIGLDIAFDDPTIGLAGAAIAVIVDIDNGVGAVLRLSGVDFGGGPVDLEIDSNELGADLVDAVRLLLDAALKALSGSGARIARLADHLFAVLGLTGDSGPVPALRLERVLHDPSVVLAWLTDVVDTPATLKAWSTHLAGLIGADLGASGEATEDLPLRAPLLAPGEPVQLQLLVAASADGQRLRIGLAVEVTVDIAVLDAEATILDIPLHGTARTAVVPDVAVLLRAPRTGTLVDAAPALRLGGLRAGLRLRGGQVQPWLALTGVTLDGVDHGSVDLTDADAVVGVVTASVTDLLADAFGDGNRATALMALLGLGAPSTDPTSPHRLDAATLIREPTAALARMHREILADPNHPWGALLGDLGVMLGLGTALAGTAGTAADPWRVEIASLDPVHLYLAAWNARDDQTPAGEQRLRLGLLATAERAPFTSRWLAELFAVDLPATGAGRVEVVGLQSLELVLHPDAPVRLPSGLSVGAASVTGSARWRPGHPLTLGLVATDVTVNAVDESYGPVTWTLPGTDLDHVLGDAALGVLRLLGRQALHAYGGDAAYVLGSLLGIHRGLPSLPADWPLLRAPEGGGLASVFADPAAVLRDLLHRLATEQSYLGTPFADRALRIVGALLRSWQVPAGTRPSVDVDVTGRGTAADPWAVPLTGTRGGTAVPGADAPELLVWLEPDGPPAQWLASLAAQAAGVLDGPGLVRYLDKVAAAHPTLHDRLYGLDPAHLGPAFDALAAWLRDGDGVVPLAAALPAGPTWQHGEIVAVAHQLLPGDGGVIDQVAAQLTDWAAGPVVLVAPRFADRTSWNALLNRLEPGRPSGAHFDLRAVPNPAEVDLTQVSAVAGTYTADLLAGAGQDEVDQLGLVVDRVLALTGAASVTLVAHSTAGVVARTLAARRPGMVSGLITLGTPHGGSPLGPLTDPAQAAALRVAAAVAGPLAGTGTGSALHQLAAMLDGAAGPLGAPIAATALSGVPAGLVDSVPGLAIGSALGGDLIGLLCGAAIVDAPAASRAPTHLAVGVRSRIAVPAAAAGQVSLAAAVRVDLARVRLVPDAAEPDRPARSVSVELRVERPGGWLVGTGTGGAQVRVRWLDAGVSVVPGAPGSVAGTPWLTLHEAGVGGVPAGPRRLGDDELAPILNAVLADLSAAPGGSPAEHVLELLRAAGLVIDTADGARASRAGLADLVTVPTRTLAGRRDALLAMLRGAAGMATGPLVLDLGSSGLELSVDLASGGLRLRTTRDLALAEPFAARLDVRFDLATLAPTVTTALLAGPAMLAVDSAGAVTIEAPPWLAQVALRPYNPPALAPALSGLLPRLALSAAVTALFGARTAATIGPIDVLLHDPIAWLLRDEALGTGGRLDGDKVNNLLKTVGGALGLDAAQGLALPGGYLITASGADPLRFDVSGTFGDPTVATLTVDLGVEVHPAGSVNPAGSLTAMVALPGDWGAIRIRFSLDSTGVGLVVTPDNIGPIRLLPTVDGVGVLIDGATALLPKVLQEAVTRLHADPGPHDVLEVILRLAAALGIYGPDAAGFTEPARAARLRAMLQPGWLEHAVADSDEVAQLLKELFAPGTGIQLPAGQTVDRDGDLVRWTMPILTTSGTSEVFVEVGWSASGPQVLVGLTGLDTGPVVIVEARLGYAGGLSGHLVLAADPGGDLDFFTPQLELGADGAGFAARLLPLGSAAAANVQIVLAPTPSVTLTGAGALQLVESWLVPLVARFLLPLFTTELGSPLWPGGPSPRQVLEGAGLVRPNTSPPQLAHPLPALPQLSLGGLAALLNGATVHLTEHLELSARAEGGRLGLGMHGYVAIEADGPDGVDVEVRFGAADWLTDPAAGVTFWLLREAPGANPPFEIDPMLSVVGLGGLVSGAGDALLIKGPVEIGGIGALVFFEAGFLDEHRRFTLDVTHLGAAVEVNRARISVESGDGDSLVSKLLPKELRAPFSLALADRDGQLEIHGGIGGKKDGIELTFPLDLDLFHVIYLKELYLAAFVRNNATEAIAAISGSASLGPLAAAVTRVGLRVVIDRSGAHLAFKLPDGFGVSMDASVIKVGGFLLVDAEHGRYVGAIEISVFGKFQLTAIGIVTTKHPDGTPGFSLLLLITVQLPVPIPIGYGFYFAGAGGLLGLNRGMDLDRMRDGLRTGTADSILFPTDIIRRIDKIVRDLEESFPQADNHFLIAPMVAIQWMNPALVALKLGIIVEIASPPRIAILGVLRLALPTASAAVVDLKVAFLGSVDFAAGLLSFDAAIYDSFIGYDDFKLSLEGDIAIRVSWGPKPDLVASIGGFHPSYTPDASLKLPAMRRITLSLLKDNPRITMRLYMAVTSNTVQFGAHLELFVGVSGFSVSGEMGFDVLIQFSPFHLDAHMYARLSVKAGGTDVCAINLDLTLSGPTPWIAHGTARISVLFINVSVEVEARMGAEQQPEVASEPILNRVLDLLRDPKSWMAELDPAISSAVGVLPAADGALVIDAAGLLSVRQNLIPLATDIGLVGSAPPADVRRVTITQLRFGAGAGAAVVEHEDVLAGYAPASFAGAPTADADRLRAPSFVQRPTGVRARSGANLAADLALPHQLAYERIVLDDPDTPAVPVATSTLPVNLARLVAGGAVGSSDSSRQRRRIAERGRAVAAVASEPRFAVTAIDDLTPVGDDGNPLPGAAVLDGALVSRTDAECRLAGLVAAGRRRYQIVPEVQLAG